MPTHNLPQQPTLFIGREQEIVTVRMLLGDPNCRLLTLVGPGGIGKTRLALEIAQSIAGDVATPPAASAPLFPDGVYLVSLQPLNSSDFLVPAMADALGLRFYPGSDPLHQLLDHLREKALLLVLDNFEHLLDGADLLIDMVEHANRMKLLVTSRERLRLREEWVFDVRGLSYPTQNTIMQFDDYSAVQLFIHSAHRIGYVASEVDMQSIIQICQLIQGMPLAVELAAAWVRVMPCVAIAREIEHSLDILTATTRNLPGKHRSVRAAFDHSWMLLSQDEQAVFRKLSVFRGGFTREAAEQVTGASLLTLAALVDKSLVLVAANGRYDLHELLRQYALEKLTEAGEMQATLDHHRNWFLALAERAEPELFAANQLDWFSRLELEYGNLWAAIGWSLESGDSAASLRLASLLYFFWELNGHRREGYERLIDILSLPQARVRTAMRAKALSAAGYLQLFENNFAEARPLLEEALAIARELGDQREIGRALRYLGPVLYNLGESDTAGLALEESLALARRLQDASSVAWSLMFLGDVALQQGDIKQAQRLYEESIDGLRELNDNVHLAYALRRLGLVMRESEDYGRSRDLCQESLALNLVSQDRRAVAASLVGLAGLAIVQDDTIRAAQLLGAVETLITDIAAHLLLADRREFERHAERVRARLEAQTLKRAWSEGKSITMEQAAAYASGDTTTAIMATSVEGTNNQEVSTPDQASSQLFGEFLTTRELEILQLIADGLSNRDIADKLVIATGTVRWHTKHIYSKLDVHSRIQAVSRARKLKLLA